MSSKSSPDSSARVCAKCGESKPLTEFDRRFIGKNTRVLCAACRQEKRAKEEAAWAARREEERRHERELRRETEGEQRERERRYQERVRRLEAWQSHLRAQGCDDEDMDSIRRILDYMLDSGQFWIDIKQQYHALHPPFAREHTRLVTNQATRRIVYDRQVGRCFYCNRELLPLEVWKKGPDGRSVVDRMTREERDNRTDSGIPELDHFLPLSRGGSHTLDNLRYACRKCNQAKSIRTPEEFAQMPDDAITKLGILPGSIAAGLALEARGYRLDGPEACAASR